MFKLYAPKKYPPALSLIVLLALLTSCRTLPESVPPVAPVIIDWPVFPDPVNQITLDGETVKMSADYWLKIVQYVIDTETGISIYEGVINGK